MHRLPRLRLHPDTVLRCADDARTFARAHAPDDTQHFATLFVAALTGFVGPVLDRLPAGSRHAPE